MRISNDCPPIELILTLCSPCGVTAEDTAFFFSRKEESSHDWLVSEWTRKVEYVLQCYSKYGHDVTPLQGLGDNGVDVLMQTKNNEKVDVRVGFQLKSNREADNNAKEKLAGPESSLTKTMKRQMAEARWHHKLQEWWFIQCFDYVRHERLVHTNHSELPPNTDGNFILRHIGPRAAFAFLSRSDEETLAICLLYLCHDDEVLREASKELSGLSRLARAIVEDTLFEAIEEPRGMQLRTRRLLDWTSYPCDDCPEEDEQEDPVEAVNELEQAQYLNRDRDSEDSYQVLPTAFPALCALYFEARVRHSLRPDKAASFARSLLNAQLPKIEVEF